MLNKKNSIAFISNGMKKIFLISAILLVVPVVAFAQGFIPLAPIPGLTQGVTADTAGLAAFFNNLYKYLIGLAAALAVIMIIWGGLEISTQDSVSKKGAGKEKIEGAIFGLVLVLSPVLVFSIINPSILNLSLNLPPLGTVTGAQLQAGGGTQTSTTNTATAAATAAGCTVTGTLLKTAICPTQQAAQNFANACATGAGNVPFFTTEHKATCGTESGAITGPYSFADTSTGILSTIVGYSNYQPLVSTPSNPNNGNAVVQFASACTADRGTTCMSTIKLPCASSVVQLVTTNGSASCWNISLSCTSGSTGAGGCSNNPQFTAVQ